MVLEQSLYNFPLRCLGSPLVERPISLVEPTVSHHFDTDSQTKTLRTERPTNLNLLCGVRMTY